MPFGALVSGAYYSDCEIKKEVLTKDWSKQALKLWEWSNKAVMKFQGPEHMLPISSTLIESLAKAEAEANFAAHEAV